LADGETHQGVFDISYLRHLPNMKILSPKDENELQHMIYTATCHDDGPIAVRYPRGAGLGVKMDDDLKQIPLGNWEVLKEGKDLSILAFGTMVPVAMEAAEKLETLGIHVEVVNARSIKPLDHDKLTELAKSQRPILTIEETALLGGFGSAVLEFFHENHYHSMVVERMGIPDRYIEHGSVPQLLEEIGLTSENVAIQVEQIIPRKRKRA
jgi:1-deoxy-D-xylulose-5-phosphate synthase